MNRLATASALALFTFAPLAGCATLLGQAGAQAEPQGPVSLSPEESVVLSETNLIRKAHGLTVLLADARLVAVARARSRDMVKRGYLEHQTPEGRSSFMIMRDHKIAFNAAGENLGQALSKAAEAPREVVAGWAKAPAQRLNLLAEGFTRVGIGAIRTADGKSVVVTEIFAD